MWGELLVKGLPGWGEATCGRGLLLGWSFFVAPMVIRPLLFELICALLLIDQEDIVLHAVVLLGKWVVKKR